MEYTIAPAADGAYVVLTIRGEISRRIALRLDIEAHALGRRLRISRYLVDVREARNTDTATETYEFAYGDLQTTTGIDRRARVATLVTLGDHSHDFTETVVRNTGLDVKIFTDLDEARRFLADDTRVETAASGG